MKLVEHDVTKVHVWLCVEKKINSKLRLLNIQLCESSHKDLEQTTRSVLNLCSLLCSVSVQASSQPASICVISIKGVFFLE